MFENITFESILDRMLDRVPNNVDKREGSIIWNALAPAAVEMQEMYIALGGVLNETFADTATRENLIKRAAERGITPDQATYAVFKGEFNINIPIGSRFSLGDFNYSAVEKLDEGIFQMQCETLGAAPNQFLGNLIPIEYIDGLVEAELTELLIPGEDEEDTEAFRQKYFDSFESQAFGGNIADYKEKVNRIPGVGGVKVYRAWDGGGTVKLVIINSNFNKPSSTLISAVQEEIDPLEHQGDGLGLAPIDHIVTVFGVEETAVNIVTSITYEDGWSWEDIQSNVYAALDKYFQELNATWAGNERIVVRISQIESRLLDLTGVLDIANTTLNGVSENLVLDEENIPIRGEVSG